MFCCTLLCVHSSIAIILMGKRELVALDNLSSWRLVMVERLFLAVSWGCLRLVIVVFPDHTQLLFFISVDIYCLTTNTLLYVSIPLNHIFIIHEKAMYMAAPCKQFICNVYTISTTTIAYTEKSPFPYYSRSSDLTLFNSPFCLQSCIKSDPKVIKLS